MSPYQIFVILWRRSWIVALTFLAAIAAAGAVLLFVPASYDGVATANVDQGRTELLGQAAADERMVLVRQGNLIALAESQRVALAVVKQLNLAADPAMQAGYRQSDSFGREPIENWVADQILQNVEAKFGVGSYSPGSTVNAGLTANILNIRYRTASPNQAAVVANAFLAATIDASIALKVEAGQQTSRWFQPRIAQLKDELDEARASLQRYQQETSMAPAVAGQDSESARLMEITEQIQSVKASLTAMESRVDSPSPDISSDPSDPDTTLVSNLKSRVSDLQAEINLEKSQLGANNPKVIASMASLDSLLKQRDQAIEKMRSNLRERIAQTKDQVKALEAAREKAVQDLIHIQGQRDKLAELQRQVAFKQELKDAEEKAAAQADLESKLTFSDITVLDKATPPTKPSFPKPVIVLSAAVAGGIALGLILALIAESIDRRVRFPEDLAFAASAPALGVVAYKRPRAPRLRLRPPRVAPAE